MPDERVVNPFAAPRTQDSVQAPKPGNVSIVSWFGMMMVLAAFEFALAFLALTPRPKIDKNLILLLVEIGPIVAAIFCGLKSRFRKYFLPLSLGNVIAWGSFVMAVRSLHSVGWTSVSISSSDVPYFAAIAVASGVVVLVVAGITEHTT